MKLVISLLVVCLFVPLLAESRSVILILKSGKVLRGDFISQDGETIQLKDHSGVVLSTRMATVEKVTEPALPASERRAIEPVEKSTSPSLADIASRTKRSRTGKARVFTMEDLAETPEVSVVGGATSDLPAPDEDPATGHDREFWQKRIDVLKKEIASLHQKERTAGQQCESARSVHILKPKKANGVIAIDPSGEPAECERLVEIRRQITDAESRLDELQMQARHDGAPWSWLE